MTSPGSPDNCWWILVSILPESLARGSFETKKYYYNSMVYCKNGTSQYESMGVSPGELSEELLT